AALRRPESGQPLAADLGRSKHTQLGFATEGVTCDGQVVLEGDGHGLAHLHVPLESVAIDGAFECLRALITLQYTLEDVALRGKAPNHRLGTCGCGHHHVPRPVD